MSLEAPPGWGKTRVGTEFYAQLAKESQSQSSPKYWPARISDTSLYRVAPDEPREEGSVPKFLWWGLSCSIAEGHRAAALEAGRVQLDTHGRYVSLACLDSRPRGKKAIEKVMGKRWEVAQEITVEALQQIFNVAGAAVPGLGLVFYVARQLKQQHQIRVSNQQAVAGPTDMAAAGRGFVKEIVNGLCAIGRTPFPIVLFVDDVHLANDTLLEALNGLLHGAPCLLVVTTTIPGMIEQIPELSDLARDLGQRRLRIGYGSSVPEDPFEEKNRLFEGGARLTELDSAAKEEIVRAYYANADHDTVARLADRYKTPRDLEIVCTLDLHQKKFGRKGDLRLTPKEIEELPRRTAGLYRKFWEQIPESHKFRYGVAAAISPAAISPDQSRGHYTWDDSVLAEVIKSLDMPTASDLHTASEATTDAYGWVMRVDEYLRRWSVVDHQNVASSGGNELFAGCLDDPHAEVLSAVAKVALRDTSPSVHTAHTIIALHAADFITEAEDLAQVAKATAVILGHLSYDDTAISERRHLYALYLKLYSELDHSSIDAETDLEVRFNGIDAIAQSGRPDLAVNAYRELLRHVESDVEVYRRHGLRLLHELAVALSNAGQKKKAAVIFARIVELPQEEFGKNPHRILLAWINLAVSMRDTDQIDRAINLFESILKGSKGKLDDEFFLTLTTRHNLAVALVMQGSERVPEGIDMLEEVIGHHAAFFGERHPETLATRHNKARALLSARRLDEAIPELRQVLKAHLEVVGPDHPNTVTTRLNLIEALRDSASTSGDADQLIEAAAIIIQVLNTRIRILGSDHTETMISYMDLAQTLGNLLSESEDTERLAEATAMLNPVLDEYNNILGPGPNELLIQTELAKTLSDLALASGDTERIKEAAATLEKVYKEHSKKLGPDDPDTLLICSHLGAVWLDMGRARDAVELFELVHKKYLQNPGEKHPATWASLHNLAWALLEARQINDAVDKFRQAFNERKRILLDPDDPQTLSSRHGLACALLQADEFTDAREEFEEVWEARKRTLGPDDPDTLDSYRGLLEARQAASRSDET